MKIEIPIVDLQLPGKGSDSSKECVSQELDTAFSSVGFVYIKNHGIDHQLIENLFHTSKKFFELLPVATKNNYSWDMNTFEGYTGQDREIFDSAAHQHEVREAYDITSPTGTCPDAEIPEFRPAVNQLASELCRVTMELLDWMSLALGLEKTYLRDRHQHMFCGVGKNGTILRTLYYPPLSNQDANNVGLVRCGEHSDYGTITLLIQDDMGGLEVLSGSDWIPAVPIPDAILVNLGDLMQFWTSNRYKATVHRVRVPEEEIRQKSLRQSIAFFVNPDNGVLVQPFQETKEGGEAPVEALAYLRRRLSETYQY